MRLTISPTTGPSVVCIFLDRRNKAKMGGGGGGGVIM
jgi:hypothetical protein